MPQMAKCEIDECKDKPTQILMVKELDKSYLVCDTHFIELTEEIDAIKTRLAGMTTDQLQDRLDELNKRKTYN